MQQIFYEWWAITKGIIKAILWSYLSTILGQGVWDRSCSYISSSHSLHLVPADVRCSDKSTVANFMTFPRCCCEVSFAVICKDLKLKLTLHKLFKYFLWVCNRRWIVIVCEWYNLYYCKDNKIHYSIFIIGCSFEIHAGPLFHYKYFCLLHLFTLRVWKRCAKGM